MQPREELPAPPAAVEAEGPVGASLPEWVPGKRYVMLEKLGQGATGTVHRAWDLLLVRSVAIEILRPDVGDLAMNVRERFLREARTMARLRHAGIVTVHDVGERKGCGAWVGSRGGEPVRGSAA